MLNNKNTLYVIIAIYLIILIFRSSIVKSLLYILCNNIKICGFFSYFYIYREIFIEKTYDFLPVKDNMVIFDVGANIGLYNLYLNSKAKNLKVYSFEPVPQIFELLKHNASKYPNNVLINKGLGEENKTITMNYVKNASAMSSGCEFSKDKLEAHDYIYQQNCGIFKDYCKMFLENELANPKKVKGEITTISDIIKEYNVEKIDILKIDVECYEYNVLEGIKEDDFKIINNVIIEIENFRVNQKDKIVNLLLKNNFKIDKESLNNKENWINIHAYK